jgi:hypothetical protein
VGAIVYDAIADRPQVFQGINSSSHPQSAPRAGPDKRNNSKLSAEWFDILFDASSLPTEGSQSINYPASVTTEGETLHIRVSVAPLPDVCRAICHSLAIPIASP